MRDEAMTLADGALLGGGPNDGNDPAARFAACRALQHRAHALIPGGCHTYAKGDDQYPVLAPGFIARGQGCHVWDADGNRYIEFGMGNRAVGLGHAHPAVIEAARAAMGDGCNFTRPARIEVEAAEQFLELVATAEMVKFAKDGSDATTGAMRLARAYTGRDYIAICGDQPFFSVDDWFIGKTAMSGGIPTAITDLTLTFRYGDLDDARALFERHPNKIAALILEAARTEDPPAGYLEALKALCHANGTLLIFDEMVTGFRWHNGGAQARYGVTPDLSCFGKAMANGFSVSALAGTREVMRLGGLDHLDLPRVFLLSTTHGAETHALAAAMATMRIYRDEPVVAHLIEQGLRLQRLARQVIDRHGLDQQVTVKGHPGCLFFTTADLDGKPSQGFRSLLLQEMIRRGVLAPSFVISYAHDAAVIDEAMDAFDGALAVYRQALEDGFERHLVGRPSQGVYRHFNTVPMGMPSLEIAAPPAPPTGL